MILKDQILSTILDVLAYNTYITSYNANMVANEVFIDSATLRENVVALAQEISVMCPRSRKAARATDQFFQLILQIFHQILFRLHLKKVLLQQPLDHLVINHLFFPF